MKLFSLLAAQAVDNAAESLNKAEKLINDIWVSFSARIPTIIIAIIILIVGMLVSKLAVKLMTKAMDKSKLDLTVNRFVGSAVKIVLYVLAVIIALTVLGVPMTSIITVIGTAGVAVGLALQSSLSNLAGGFLILFAKPFKVGSYIKCSGEEGTVESITILYTKILTVDNKAVFIPNGTAANAVLVNYSDIETRRVDLTAVISSAEKLDRAVKSIEKAIEGDAMILRDGDKAPFIRLLSHDALSMTLTVRLWVKSEDYWDVYFNALEAIRNQFIADNIIVPVNKLEVNVKQ